MEPRFYVYLIGSRTFHWYKIGKAKHAKIRLRNIGVLLPFKVELFAVWAAWSKDAEQCIHRKYAWRRINGEWFHFKYKELRAVISTPQENMTLLEKSSLEFTNIERDCSEGKSLHVKIIGVPSKQQVLEYILVRKLKQAARDF